MKLSKKLTSSARPRKSPIQDPAVSPGSIWLLLESMAERLMKERLTMLEGIMRRHSREMEESFNAAQDELSAAVVQLKRNASEEINRHIRTRSLEIKGPKGDKGDKGDSIKGDKGDSIKGDKGDRGDQGEPGKDGSPDTPEEIVTKINSAQSLIDPDRIKGLKQAFSTVRSRRGGGGDVVEAGTNVTITRTADGKRRISAGAGATLYVETPTGDVNGVNTSYTVAETITTVINFSINGQFIHPADYNFSGTTITFNTPLDASLTGLPFTIVYA